MTVLATAVGDWDGEAFLDGEALYGHVTNNEHGTGTAIKMTAIDQWAKQADIPVNYIKADVEGFEMALLRGASETIKCYQPKLAITVYHPENDWQAIRSFLQKLVPHYQFRVKGLFFKGGGVRPMVLHVWPAQNNVPDRETASL